MTGLTAEQLAKATADLAPAPSVPGIPGNGETRGSILDGPRDEARHDELRRLSFSWAAKGVPLHDARDVCIALGERWGLGRDRRGEIERLVEGAYLKLQREGKLSADDADHERMIPKPDAVDLEGVVHPSAGAVEYLAVNLIPKSECTIIGATYKSGKTLFGYGAVLDLCTGRKVWGRFDVPDPVRCVVFQLEMPLAEDERRYRRIAIGSGMEPQEIPALVRAGMLVHYSRPDLDLTTPRGVRLFHDLVRDADAGLVYLDSIIAAFAGADLNDNSTVRRLFAQAFGPLTSEGRTIAANHHKRKAHANTQDDARSALLGAQAWGAAAGRIYGLERLADGDDPHDAKNALRCRLTLTGSWTPGAADDLILEAVDTPDGGTLIRTLDDRAQAERGGVTATQRAALALTRIVRLRRCVDRKAAFAEVMGDLDIRERAVVDALKYAKAKGWVDSERKPGTTTNEQVLAPGPNAEDAP